MLGGWYFSEKVPIKMCTPPPRGRCKILVPSSPESLTKMGTPPSRVPEAFQGSRCKSRKIGIQRRGGIAQKGHFALFCFLLCAQKMDTPSPDPPSEPLLETGTPHSKLLSKMGAPPPGCWKLIRAAGASCAKGTSRAAGELCERDILLCSVSFFLCV